MLAAPRPRLVGVVRVGNILGDVVDDVGSVASTAVDVVSAIPGVSAAASWVADRLHDFANTDVGKFVLRALSSATYMTLAPYLGAQLAAVAFAIPGLMKGDSFTQAWTEEFAWRVEATAEILGPQAGQAVSDELQPAVDKLKALGDQATGSIEEIIQKTGWKGRDDVMAMARDLYTHQHLVAVDPPDLPGATADVVKKAWGNLVPRDGDHFDPLTGKHITNPALVIPATRLAAMVKAGDPAVQSYLASIANIGPSAAPGMPIVPPMMPPASYGLGFLAAAPGASALLAFDLASEAGALDTPTLLAKIQVMRVQNAPANAARLAAYTAEAVRRAPPGTPPFSVTPPPGPIGPNTKLVLSGGTSTITPAQAAQVTAAVGRASQLLTRQDFVAYYLSLGARSNASSSSTVGCGSCCASCAERTRS